jgi:Peptidase family M23
MGRANASRMRVRSLAPLLLALGVWGAIPTGTAVGAVGRGVAVDRLDFAPIVSSVLTRPTPVKATDGRFHIVYEVLLTNNVPNTMAVESFEVRDARTRRVLARLSGPALAANMGPLAGPPATDPDDAPSDLNPAAGLSEQAASDASTTMASSQTSAVWLDLKVGSARPRSLEHLITASSRPPPGAQFSFSGLVGRVRTGGTPVVIGPPVGPGLWVADEGCCTNPTHHRRALPGFNGELLAVNRFAIDWVLVDSSHRAWIGDPTRLSSYLSYRQPLIAAASGRVVGTHDGVPNNPPQGVLTGSPPIKDFAGNWVSIRIGPRRYLLYAHMVPGSVRVRPGQQVRRGQVIGLLGNSGNTSTPHLHFQVSDRPGFAPVDSLPYVFDRFAFLGQITDEFTDENLAVRPTGELAFAPSGPPRVRRQELPLDRNVLRFP